MSFNAETFHGGDAYRTVCGGFVVKGMKVVRSDLRDRTPVSAAEAKAARAERDEAMRTSARGAPKNR